MTFLRPFRIFLNHIHYHFLCSDSKCKKRNQASYHSNKIKSVRNKKNNFPMAEILTENHKFFRTIYHFRIMSMIFFYISSPTKVSNCKILGSRTRGLKDNFTQAVISHKKWEPMMSPVCQTSLILTHLVTNHNTRLSAISSKSESDPR